MSLRALCLAFLILSAHAACEEGRTIYDFSADFDPAPIVAWHTKIAKEQRGEGNALVVDFAHDTEWPGITLKAPQGAWDLGPFTEVVLDARNPGDKPLALGLRVDNAGGDGNKNCCQGTWELAPGERRRLRLPLKRRAVLADPSKLFGMRGTPFHADERGAIDPSRVTQFIVFVPRPNADKKAELFSLRAEGRYEPPADLAAFDAKTFFPFVDRFGQYRHKDWPGKVGKEEDLAARREAEARELEARPGPASWNDWGGWKDGPALEATGFFRAAKHEGKWWLVDPGGRLFFSHGIDCVRDGGATPVDERDGWFLDFPGKDEAYRDFFSVQGHVVHDHYKGRQPRCFSFSKANLLRKYGADWGAAYAGVSHRRLRSWGLNTIGNWSDPEIYLRRKTPYVVAVHFGGKPLAGSEGYWGQFRDVFDPDFGRQLKARMEQERGQSAGDPYCIGYFVDNEIGWGHETSLAEAALASPAEQRAKQAFVDDLKAKYGEIAKLNAAWGTAHASWDALRAERKPPDKTKARADLVAFYERTCETYFKTVRDAVREVAPKQLYLGCRFAWVNDAVARSAAAYCDVVSYNLYRTGVAEFKYPGPDKPLIVGEFHFGALDRGLFHPGLVPVATQAARAKAYFDYVSGALRHPQFVGCHWFQYVDQPLTGRGLDGENYQIGFLDGCDTPYPETVEAAREVGYKLYEIRAGKP
ncbi:MAG: beta-galactosidase [Planctomycetota bacterium]|nr:beta-galactosidase [Planctomycetota bacterium]